MDRRSFFSSAGCAVLLSPSIANTPEANKKDTTTPSEHELVASCLAFQRIFQRIGLPFHIPQIEGKSTAPGKWILRFHQEFTHNVTICRMVFSILVGGQWIEVGEDLQTRVVDSCGFTVQLPLEHRPLDKSKST